MDSAHRPLYLALQAEMDAYAAILEQEFLKFNMAKATGKDYAPYGQPLTHGTDGRYEFWPSMKAKMPLLYYCAARLLAGDGNATASNERTHSPATRITDRLRASMKPDTVEKLTLCHIFMRQHLEAEMDTAAKIVALEKEEENLLLQAEQEAAERAEAGLPEVLRADSDEDRRITFTCSEPSPSPSISHPTSLSLALQTRCYLGTGQRL